MIDGEVPVGAGYRVHSYQDGKPAARPASPLQNPLVMLTVLWRPRGRPPASLDGNSTFEAGSFALWGLRCAGQLGSSQRPTDYESALTDSFHGRAMGALDLLDFFIQERLSRAKPRSDVGFLLDFALR